MDVTFLEHQPYHPKTELQGERTKEESQLWKLKDIIATETEIPAAKPATKPQSVVQITAETEAEMPRVTAEPEMEMPETTSTTETGENAPAEPTEEGSKTAEIRLTEEGLKPTTQVDKQLLVFSRRHKTKKKPKPSTAQKQSQDSTRITEPVEVQTRNTAPTLCSN